MSRICYVSILAALSLSACTTVSDLPVGTSLGDAQQQFGSPSVLCPTNNPERAVWSSQPFGQFAWAMNLDQNQRLTSANQVLTDAEFEQLRQGSWSQEQVRCHFGPPAEKSITPYRGIKMQVWSYRYKQNGVWDSLMHIYFSDEGLVKHHHPGPDPLTEADGVFFF